MMLSKNAITVEDIRAASEKLPGLFHMSLRDKAYLGLKIFLPAVIILFCLDRMEITISMLISGIGQLGWLLDFFFPPSPGGWFWDFVKGMGETLAMAFLGTLFGFLLAVPFGFIGAKNVVSNPIIHFSLRRCFDFIRSVDSFIWALMIINIVGMGPFAGILAITITDAATLSKLFAEAVENVDRDQIEGTQSTGAGKIQILRYAFIPQIFPIMISNVFYFFESNVRSASILGMLGAGGIGMHLTDRFRAQVYDQAGFIIIMILITVAIIDYLSRILRLRMINNPEYRQ
jgi:phosphonate transport system permease protein